MVHFGEFLKTWSLRSNSVTRPVSFNKTKIGGKCHNSNATFWVIFKQCASTTFLRYLGCFTFLKRWWTSSLEQYYCVAVAVGQIRELDGVTFFFKGGNPPACIWNVHLTTVTFLQAGTSGKNNAKQRTRAAKNFIVNIVLDHTALKYSSFSIYRTYTCTHGTKKTLFSV